MEITMLLSIGELASALGVSVVTLRLWDKAGKLAPSLRTVGGHRRYHLSEAIAALGGVDPLLKEDQSNKRLVVGHARVSCADQKADLLRQKERLEAHLSNTPHSLVLTDLGSGLNFKKRGLTKLLALVMAGRVEKVVITHKDRLMRFGYELFEQVVQGHGGKIEMLENVSSHDETELAHDVLAIITVFSARLYGRRSHQNRQKAA
jgi:putative resolvase